MDVINRIVLTSVNLILIDRTGLLQDFVDSFLTETYTIGHISYWICQNPTFPQMKSFLSLDNYVLKLIRYNRFSFNVNFPTDIELVKKLNEKNLICWRDVERNNHIKTEHKEKLMSMSRSNE